MANNKSDAKKTMDVSKPGKSVPDISARPILVTHRPMVQDPMMKDDKKLDESPAGDLAESKQEPAIHGSKVIAPIGEQPETDPSTEATANEEQKPDPEPEAEPEKTPEEKIEAEEAAVVDAVADQATDDKKKKNQLSDAEKAQQEAVQKLIAEKKYFVPIGKVTHRRNQRMAVILLVVVLLLAGAYVAIDAAIIKLAINLPIDLIKN